MAMHPKGSYLPTHPTSSSHVPKLMELRIMQLSVAPTLCSWSRRSRTLRDVTDAMLPIVRFEQTQTALHYELNATNPHMHTIPIVITTGGRRGLAVSVAPAGGR